MESDDDHAARTSLDRTTLAVLAIAALALLARLVFLGERVAHWDEGRVGYDILRYVATGAWEYRPIVHGPFLPQVNRFVFELLGASDFTARLVVAVVGGLFPLSALLFRERLRDRRPSPSHCSSQRTPSCSTTRGSCATTCCLLRS